MSVGLKQVTGVPTLPRRESHMKVNTRIRVVAATLESAPLHTVTCVEDTTYKPNISVPRGSEVKEGSE